MSPNIFIKISLSTIVAAKGESLNCSLCHQNVSNGLNGLVRHLQNSHGLSIQEWGIIISNVVKMDIVENLYISIH